MKFLIIFLFLIFSNEAFSKKYYHAFDAKKCSKSKISKRLKRMRSLNKRNHNYFKKVIYDVSKAHNIDCTLLMTHIKVESDFVFSKGPVEEVSIAQISYGIWNKIFKREGSSLDKKKLKVNKTYAIDRMGWILSYLRKKYYKRDSMWFLRYNTGYFYFKLKYLHLMEYQLKRLGLVDNYVDYRNKRIMVNSVTRKKGAQAVLEIYTRLYPKSHYKKLHKERIAYWNKLRKKRKKVSKL